MANDNDCKLPFWTSFDSGFGSHHCLDRDQLFGRNALQKLDGREDREKLVFSIRIRGFPGGYAAAGHHFIWVNCQSGAHAAFCFDRSLVRSWRFHLFDVSGSDSLFAAAMAPGTILVDGALEQFVTNHIRLGNGRFDVPGHVAHS